jgi:hypothetical protein
MRSSFLPGNHRGLVESGMLDNGLKCHLRRVAAAPDNLIVSSNGFVTLVQLAEHDALANKSLGNLFAQRRLRRVAVAPDNLIVGSNGFFV